MLEAQQDTTPAPEAAIPPTDAPEPEAGTDAPEAAAEAPPKPEPEQSRPAKTGLQRRIDELTRQRHEAERQLETERLERFRMEAQQAAVQRVQAIDAREPSPDQYETTSDYLRAHANWASQRAIEVFDARAAVQQSEEMARQAAEHRRQSEMQATMQGHMQTMEQKLGKGPEKYADFVEVLTNPDLPSSMGTPLFDAVMASDNAVDIAYALGKNPAEYERLLRLSMQNPAAAFKEVLTMDMKFGGASKTTTAPPPPPDIKGNAPVHKDPNDMPYEEFVKWRRRSIAARKSR